MEITGTVALNRPLPTTQIAHKTLRVVAMEVRYSKVSSLRHCIIRNSGLISLNRIPLYMKLSRLIHVQFLLQWCIVSFHGIYLNMPPIRLSSLETRMKILSPDCYHFKKLSVLAQTFGSLWKSAYSKNAFLTSLIDVWNVKVFLIPWYTYPVWRKYILT